MSSKTLTHADDTAEFPRNWRFDEDGQELVGRYVGTDEGPTANGPCPILLIEIDGEERSVWCFHTALRRRIADEIARRPSGDLKKGERIVIRQGEKKASEGGREYISYYVGFPDAPKRVAKDIFRPDPIDEPPASYDEPEPATTGEQGDDDIPF